MVLDAVGVVSKAALDEVGAVLDAVGVDSEAALDEVGVVTEAALDDTGEVTEAASVREVEVDLEAGMVTALGVSSVKESEMYQGVVLAGVERVGE